jgi:outer membrane protein TolC
LATLRSHFSKPRVATVPPGETHAARQALEVECAKFEASVATTYEFMQYQSSVAQAKSAAVTALGVYAKARTALQRAIGATLTDNNIVVDQALPIILAESTSWQKRNI